jgi:hypothetical protein
MTYLRAKSRPNRFSVIFGRIAQHASGLYWSDGQVGWSRHTSWIQVVVINTVPRTCFKITSKIPCHFIQCRGLRGWVVKAPVSYHKAFHLQPASVRILLVPMWLREKVCQFTCRRSVVSSQTHCIMYLGSLPPIKTDCHHVNEKLLSMAKNDNQTYSVSWEHVYVYTCIIKLLKLLG